MVDRLQEKRLFLGGDSAHIHSPAAAQGMNTGIQDMINLGWKLAFVSEGKASPKLLDTYNEDRIPVIRGVLSKTEQLTEVIGAENPIFRTIFEHMAPLLVETELVQEKSTAQVTQVAINYIESSLSETHGSHGALRVGDRLPDMTVRVMNKKGTAEQIPREVRLFDLLDPSLFTLLYLNVKDPGALHAELDAELASWHGIITGHQLASSEHDADAKKHYETHFGHAECIILIRPDAYIGFIGSSGSASKLVAYMQKWFPVEPKQ